MILDEVKKVFRYGWIAKYEEGNWHWYSEKPEFHYDDDYWGYYWSGKDDIEIGIIEGTEDITSLDSLIEIKGE